MAEGRMLKKRITASKKLARLKSDKARLLWFYMLPFTDIEGRIEADPEDIRDEIIRKQRKGYTIERIENCLQDLHRVGLIVLYEANNKKCLHFTRFHNEQNLRRDKEAKSKIPAPVPEQGRSGTAKREEKRSEDKLSKVKRREENASSRQDFSQSDSLRLASSLASVLEPSKPSDKSSLNNLARRFSNSQFSTDDRKKVVDLAADAMKAYQAAQKKGRSPPNRFALFFDSVKKEYLTE